MKKMLTAALLLITTLLCAMGTPLWETPAPSGETRTIVDMAGRTLTIPTKVDTILAKCMIGTTIAYSLEPSLVAGLNWYPTEAEKEFLDEDYLKLPMLSGWHAGNEGNVEEIIKTGPSLLVAASFNPQKDQASRDLAEKIEELTNIPVVIFDFRLENLPETYRFFGELTGKRGRAEELALYAENRLAEIKGMTDQLSDDDKISLYYAEGKGGLQTDPSGSFHTQVIDYAGAVNVAQVEMKGGMGRSQISPEQLMIWNPDVIICCHDQGFSQIDNTLSGIKEDPRLSEVKAIRENRVYEVPYKPFNFMDRPPSINRLIGLVWLTDLIYPDLSPFDLKNEIRDFYTLFYRIDLSEEQLDDILLNSYPKED